MNSFQLKSIQHFYGSEFQPDSKMNRTSTPLTFPELAAVRISGRISSHTQCHFIMFFLSSSVSVLHKWTQSMCSNRIEVQTVTTLHPNPSLKHPQDTSDKTPKITSRDDFHKITPIPDYLLDYLGGCYIFSLLLNINPASSFFLSCSGSVRGQRKESRAEDSKQTKKKKTQSWDCSRAIDGSFSQCRLSRDCPPPPLPPVLQSAGPSVCCSTWKEGDRILREEPASVCVRAANYYLHWI